MSKAVSIFEAPKLELPAHIANFLGEEKNIQDRTTVPSLGVEGKVFTIVMNGEKRKLMRRDDEGDEVAVGVLRVVILDFAKRRGRTYYSGGYDPAKPGAPVCWSEDGVKPHDKVEEKQHPTCDGCPLAVKGSKVTDAGNKVTACSQHRMVALVPAANLEHEPLRLKLAITSDWDKQSPELEAQGWFAFQNYTDFLRSKGITHTASVVTKVRFDPNAAYPKLLFSPDRFLDNDSLAVIAPIAKSDKVKELLTATWTPAGVDGKRTDEVEQFQQPAKKTSQVDDGEDEETPPPKQAKKKSVADDGDEEEVTQVTKPKKSTAGKKADDLIEEVVDKKVKADAKKKPTAMQLDLGDEDEEVTQAAKPKKKAEAAPKTGVPSDVADLLEEWDG